MKNNLNQITQEKSQKESQLDERMQRRARASRQKRGSERPPNQSNGTNATPVMTQNPFGHLSSAWKRYSTRSSITPLSPNPDAFLGTHRLPTPLGLSNEVSPGGSSLLGTYGNKKAKKFKLLKNLEKREGEAFVQGKIEPESESYFDKKKIGKVNRGNFGRRSWRSSIKRNLEERIEEEPQEIENQVLKIEKPKEKRKRKKKKKRKKKFTLILSKDKNKNKKIKDESERKMKKNDSQISIGSKKSEFEKKVEEEYWLKYEEKKAISKEQKGKKVKKNKRAKGRAKTDFKEKSVFANPLDKNKNDKKRNQKNGKKKKKRKKGRFADLAKLASDNKSLNKTSKNNENKLEIIENNRPINPIQNQNPEKIIEEKEAPEAFKNVLFKTNKTTCKNFKLSNERGRTMTTQRLSQIMSTLNSNPRTRSLNTIFEENAGGNGLGLQNISENSKQVDPDSQGFRRLKIKNFMCDIQTLKKVFFNKEVAKVYRKYFRRNYVEFIEELLEIVQNNAVVSQKLSKGRGNGTPENECRMLEKNFIDLSQFKNLQNETFFEFDLDILKKASLTAGLFIPASEIEKIFDEFYLCVYFVILFKTELASNFSEFVKFRPQVMQGRLEADVDYVMVHNEGLQEIFLIAGQQGMLFEKLIAFCLHVCLKLGFADLPENLAYIEADSKNLKQEQSKKAKIMLSKLQIRAQCKNLPSLPTSLTAENLGKMVSSQGIIVDVGELEQVVSKLEFRCGTCNSRFFSQLDNLQFKPLEQCAKPGCSSKKFHPQKNRVEFSFLQRIKLQIIESEPKKGGRSTLNGSFDLNSSFTSNALESMRGGRSRISDKRNIASKTGVLSVWAVDSFANELAVGDKIDLVGLLLKESLTSSDLFGKTNNFHRTGRKQAFYSLFVRIHNFQKQNHGIMENDVSSPNLSFSFSRITGSDNMDEERRSIPDLKFSLSPIQRKSGLDTMYQMTSMEQKHFEEYFSSLIDVTSRKELEMGAVDLFHGLKISDSDKLLLVHLLSTDKAVFYLFKIFFMGGSEYSEMMEYAAFNSVLGKRENGFGGPDGYRRPGDGFGDRFGLDECEGGDYIPLKRVFKGGLDDPNLLVKFLLMLMEIDSEERVRASDEGGMGLDKNIQKAQTIADKLCLRTPWQVTLLYENETALNELKNSVLFQYKNTNWKYLAPSNLLPQMQTSRSKSSSFQTGTLYTHNNFHCAFKFPDLKDKKIQERLSSLITSREFKIFQNETFCRLKYPNHMFGLQSLQKSPAFHHAEDLLSDLSAYDFFVEKAEQRSLNSVITQKTDEFSFYSYEDCLGIIQNAFGYSPELASAMDFFMVLKASTRQHERKNRVGFGDMPRPQEEDLDINTFSKHIERNLETLDFKILLKLVKSPSLVTLLIQHLKKGARQCLPRSVLTHFQEYYMYLKQINKTVDLGFFFLVCRLYMARSKFNIPSEVGKNDVEEGSDLTVANEVIEFFQEIVNSTVNLVFALERHNQTNRYKFQHVNNKMNAKQKAGKPNYLKSMGRQQRIFIETLKSLSLENQNKVFEFEQMKEIAKTLELNTNNFNLFVSKINMQGFLLKRSHKVYELYYD